ncbi:hypothetical protein GCM10010371_02170 [Streptomyces subrutilus]|uniref:Uncharacterized protein n=1 Tax=Streptomyces subrutilus TaxID=36818 RepID=A0A918QGV1_9ACTN|nr:hypothetical protein GCM10010371_02170 [Streptomyces subrutilus]
MHRGPHVRSFTIIPTIGVARIRPGVPECVTGQTKPGAPLVSGETRWGPAGPRAGSAGPHRKHPSRQEAGPKTIRQDPCLKGPPTRGRASHPERYDPVTSDGNTRF